MIKDKDGIGASDFQNVADGTQANKCRLGGISWFRPFRLREIESRHFFCTQITHASSQQVTPPHPILLFMATATIVADENEAVSEWVALGSIFD